MTPEENQRLEALESRLADVESRLAKVEGRRARAPRAASARQRLPHLEVRFGLNWLSRIAAVTVVLALAFFFEYAFENRWITELGRVGLGAACGTAALALGERAWRKQQKAYGQALTAAGIAFFYLSVWAAFALYHLLPETPAFGLMILTTAGAGALAVRYDAPAAAILGLGGGFATPLLLGSANDAWFVLGYGTVLDICAMLAARARRWHWLEAIALAGTVVLFGSQWPRKPEFGIFVVAWYGLFSSSESKPVFAATQVLAGMGLAGAMSAGPGRLLLSWVLGAAGVVLSERRGWAGGALAAFSGFWFAWWLWFAQAAAPGLAIPLAVLTLAYLTFLIWPVRLAYAGERQLGWQELTVLALNAVIFFGACYGLRPSGVFALAIAVVQMAAARLLWRRESRGAMLSAGAAWVLLVLAAPIQLAGYRVTMAWAAEAAALVWIGVRLNKRRVFWGAVGVFGLMLLRLAFVDSWMYAGQNGYALLLNARYLSFVAAAVALWASAWWVRTGRTAMALYVCGHAIMVWGLGLEAVGWAARTSTAGNYGSSASTALSVVAAAYAVVLVGAGAARQHTATRMLGIGLIGLVVVKLYLYDVWRLAAFYRMAAFAILGVLLLAVSFLYRARTVR